MKRLVFPLILAALWTGSAAAADAPAATPATSGRDLCKQNFDIYRDRLRKDPNDGAAWRELRVCADLLKRWGEAAAIASAAVEKNVKRPEPHQILGHAYYYAKDYPHALEEFKESVRLKDDQAHVYFQLGLTYLHLNQPSDAVGAGTRAVELDPENPAYHRQLAFSYFLTNEDDKCEAAAKEALKLDPNDMAVFKILSNLYTRQGKPELADQMMVESIRANGRIAAANPFVPDKRVLTEDLIPSPFTLHTPPSDTEVFLRAQWERMKRTALRADVEATASFYSSVENVRGVYRESFVRMGETRMKQVFARLGEISDCEIDASRSSAACRCPVNGGSNTMLETKVQFIKDPDNIWRIRSF
jgi:tetratricopeptide (TPR) repeat protein